MLLRFGLTLWGHYKWLLFVLCFLYVFLLLPNKLPHKQQKKVSANAETLINNGAPGTIRTCDTRLRRPLLYPTELQARIIGAGDENRTHVTSLEG